MARCVQCEEEYEQSRPNVLYCSYSCKRAAERARMARHKNQYNVTPVAWSKIRGVIRIVAQAYGRDIADLIAPCRKRENAWPRQAAMLLCKRTLNPTMGEIGASLGKRDHTTIMAGIRVAEKRLASDSVSCIEWIEKYRLAEEMAHDRMGGTGAAGKNLNLVGEGMGTEEGAAGADQATERRPGVSGEAQCSGLAQIGEERGVERRSVPSEPPPSAIASDEQARAPSLQVPACQGRQS